MYLGIEIRFLFFLISFLISLQNIRCTEFTCGRCANDQYVEVNAERHLSQCVNCPSNSVAPSDFATNLDAALGVESCECIEGYYLNGAEDSDTACVKCIEGDFKLNQGDQSCDNCNDQYSGDIDSITYTSLYLTTQNKGSTIHSDHCVCPAGRFRKFNNVNNFPLDWNSGTPATYTIPGTYSLTIEQCQNLFKQALVGPDCVDCHLECSHLLFCESGTCEACLQCPPGSFLSSTHNAEVGCTDCTISSNLIQYCPKGSSQPLQCPLNSAVIRNYAYSETQCACNAGYYNDDSGSSRLCIACPAGKYSDEVNENKPEEECKDCAIGKYSTATAAVNDETCLDCHADIDSFNGNIVASTSETGSDEFSDCFCLRGFVGTLNTYGEDSCAACAMGKYQESDNQQSCDDCDAGKYNSNTGSETKDHCLSCTGNTHTEQAGSDNADDCHCNAGFKYTDNSAGATQICEQCAAGKYTQSLGESLCSDCGRGKFSTIIGQNTETDCQNCVPGKFHNDLGRTDCDDCPGDDGDTPGTYQGSEGETSCTSCPDNSGHALSTRTSISACICNAGYSNDVDLCVPCNAGYFKAIRGDVQCEDCAAGTIQPLTGKTTCNDCERGKFVSAIRQTECDECAISSYQDEVGQSACKPCGAGNKHFTNAIGSTTRTQCRCQDTYYRSKNCVFESGNQEPKSSCNILLDDALASDASTCEICPLNHYCGPDVWKGITKCRQDARTDSTGQYEESSCTCNSGYFRDGTEYNDPCESCVKYGESKIYYCPGLDNTRSQCPSNSQTTTQNDDSVEDCLCLSKFWRNCVKDSNNNLITWTTESCDGTGDGNLFTNTAEDSGTCICDDFGLNCYADIYTTCLESDMNSAQTDIEYNNVCVSCPRDTICDSNTLQHCPQNAYSPVGSTGFQSCNCFPGYYDSVALPIS